MDPSNNTFIYLYRKKVGGPERAVEYEKLLVEWIEEKYYQIQVLHIVSVLSCTCRCSVKLWYKCPTFFRIPNFKRPSGRG
jgi:hypothetical protein